MRKKKINDNAKISKKIKNGDLAAWINYILIKF